MHTDDVKDLKYLSQERIKEIKDTFELLGITTNAPYIGPNDITKTFKKVSVLDGDGVIFTTSSNSFCATERSIDA